MSEHNDCVAYLRVSGRAQVDGFGFDRQHDFIVACAAKMGLTILREYREAHTGDDEEREEANRPMFAAMVSDLLANGCRTVIVESLDRFARNLMVQCNLLALLKLKGIRLISAITGEDVTAAMDADPMRRALVQIQGVFAELEKNLLVRKLRKGREARKAQTGRCEGPPPFGSDPKRPEESTLLGIIKASKAKGCTNQDIADYLNDAGYRGRHGGTFDRRYIGRLLKRTSRA